MKQNKSRGKVENDKPAEVKVQIIVPGKKK